MKTIIQGKNLETTYGVNNKRKQITDENGDIKTVYTGKPELTKETEIISWSTIKEFDEKIEFNINRSSDIFASYSQIGSINLSENEVITIIKKIFRVDLDAYLLYTDKVLTEAEMFKEDSEEDLKFQIKAFNKRMIESNDKLLSYCILHKLNIEETDLDELFKVVYPNDEYCVKDGKLIIGKKTTTPEYGVALNAFKTGVISAINNQYLIR